MKIFIIILLIILMSCQPAVQDSVKVEPEPSKLGTHPAADTTVVQNWKGAAIWFGMFTIISYTACEYQRGVNRNK